MLLFLQAKFLKVGLLSQKISAFLILIDNCLITFQKHYTYISVISCMLFFLLALNDYQSF